MSEGRGSAGSLEGVGEEGKLHGRNAHKIGNS